MSTRSLALLKSSTHFSCEDTQVAGSSLNHPHSPTVRGAVVRQLDHSPVQPGDGVINAGFVRVGQLLNLKLIGHEGVGHHAVHQQHEGRRGAVDQRAHTSHHHHQHLLPCGKAELDRNQKQWRERNQALNQSKQQNHVETLTSWKNPTLSAFSVLVLSLPFLQTHRM